MRDTISQLSEQIEDLEAYLGFQCGGQPLVMDCGPGTQLHYIRGGPSWRRHLGLVGGMEVEERLPCADAAADSCVEQVGLAMAMVIEDSPMAEPIGDASSAADANSVEAEADGPAIPDTAMAEGEVSLLSVPPIHVVPATPQSSQEVARQTIPMAPPLPILQAATSLPDAEAMESALASNRNVSLSPPLITDTSRTSLSPSHRPSPSPARLLQSPRPSPPPHEPLCQLPHLSPGPSHLVSRSNTPQPNTKKRAGTSEDRDEVKQGRKD
jgi:hypothetical protein